MRLILLVLVLVFAPATPAQDNPFETLSRDAGHRLGAQVRAQDPAFLLSLFEEGFRDGIAGDSSRIAYAMGLQYGLTLAADTLSQVAPEVFLDAFAGGLRGDDAPVMPLEAAQAERAADDLLVRRTLRAAGDSASAAQLAEIDANGRAARAFLDEVAARPGVAASPSGVLYTTDSAGAGPSPGFEDTVVVSYAGTLADGALFDRGERVTFSVANVVPGFAEMLMAMRPGETRTVYLPPSTAYGLRGAPAGGGGIPPNAALVFRLTLHEVADGSAP